MDRIRLNGHDTYVYLKEILTRLPTQRTSEIKELSLHRWQPASLRKTEYPGRYREGHDWLQKEFRNTVSGIKCRLDIWGPWIPCRSIV